MTLTIRNVSPLAAQSLTQCLAHDSTRVTFAGGTATFGCISVTQAVRLVLHAQARHPDRGSAGYRSIDSIVRKLRALDDPADSPVEPLTFPALLEELDRLERRMSTLTNPDHPQ